VHLQIHGSELVDCEVTTLGRTKLIEALTNCDLCDFDDVDHSRTVRRKLFIRAARTEQHHRCRLDADLSSSSPIHPLYNPDGFACHCMVADPNSSLLGNR